MDKLPKGFTAVPQGEKVTMTIAGCEYNILAVDQRGIPLVDIKMMSDERWNELYDEQHRKHAEWYAYYDQLVAEGYRGDELSEKWYEKIRACLSITNCDSADAKDLNT